MTLIHASLVAFSETGVLIKGPSGSGKSQLCLRLIDAAGYGVSEQPLKAQLVADDQVVLSTPQGQVWGTAPKSLEGLLELRGIGLVKTIIKTSVRIRLVVNLQTAFAIIRLPDDSELKEEICGVEVPSIKIDPNSPAAPALLRAALSHFKLL